MKLRNKKTGEIFDLDKMPKWLKESIQLCATFYSRECEVYEPAESLIKNERICKALRAWADVQGIKEVKYIEGIASSDFRHMFEYGGRGSNRGIIHWGRGVLIHGLVDGKTYTIAELCGEEE